jgi:excisionase family DNA binding protein
MNENSLTTNGEQMSLPGVSALLEGAGSPVKDAAPEVKKKTSKSISAPISGLLTAEELAFHFGCTVRTVWKMAANRAIPSVRFGRWVRFDPAACLEALTRKAGK